MTTYQDFYFIFTLLNILLAFALVFLERRNVSSTWAWIMVLSFIPVFGFILYLILGQQLRKRKLFKLLGDSQRIIEDTVERQKLQLQDRKTVFHDAETNDYRDMIFMNLVSSYALFSQNNAIRIYTEGNEKFDALIADICLRRASYSSGVLHCA